MFLVPLSCYWLTPCRVLFRELLKTRKVLEIFARGSDDPVDNTVASVAMNRAKVRTNFGN